MTREERAKQFAPFDALKGLQDALRVREERVSRVDKTIIGEDDAALLSCRLNTFHEGDCIKVFFYKQFHNHTLTGPIQKIDVIYHYLQIENVTIPFDDIYSIDIDQHNPGFY